MIGGALLPLGCSGTSDPYSVFQQRLETGATCQELFEIRNALDPQSPNIVKMNADLGKIGCYSASGVRSPAGAAARSAGSEASQQAAVVNPETTPTTFTVNEYRVYRTVIDTPTSVPEAESIEAVAKRYQMPVDEVKGVVDKVQKVLFANKWFGSADTEIRHASDWKGDSR
jgi:hypothetical protein